MSKTVADKSLSFPTAVTKEAMDKWPKAHQAQLKWQALAFKTYVSEVCNVLQQSTASKAENVYAAARYGLNEKLAGRRRIATCLLSLLLVSTKLLD